MHIKPADNTLSELMGVAYEKVINSMSYGLANFLGYTNGAETYAGSLADREGKATNSLGHSRGTLVQESSFTILANRPDENGNTYTNPNLTVRGVGGAGECGALYGGGGDDSGTTRREERNYLQLFQQRPCFYLRTLRRQPGHVDAQRFVAGL